MKQIQKKNNWFDNKRCQTCGTLFSSAEDEVDFSNFEQKKEHVYKMHSLLSFSILYSPT